MTRGRPCRIGVLLHDFALGGTERIAVRLANAWAKEGADVTILCGDPNGPLAAMVADTVHIHAMTPTVSRSRGSCRRLGRAVARALKDEPVDMLFIPGNYHWAAVPPIAAIGRGRPRIVAQISAALYKPQRGALRQFFFNRRMAHLLKGVDHLVAMDTVTMEQASAIVQGPALHRIETPALDDDLPPPVPTPAGPPTLIGIGRLVQEKGFADLIDAFAKVRDKTARLIVAGSGPEERALKALARNRGVAERVEFPGYVPDSRPWLDRAALFVLSSWFEGFPAVLIEAMAAGRRVVATDCTPAVTLFQARPGAGRIVPLRDSDDMAAAIDQMLEEPAPSPEDIAAIVNAHRIGLVCRRYLLAAGIDLPSPRRPVGLVAD